MAISDINYYNLSIRELKEIYSGMSDARIRKLIKKIIKNKITLKTIENNIKSHNIVSVQEKTDIIEPTFLQKENNQYNDTDNILDNLIEDDKEHIESNNVMNLEEKYVNEIEKDIKNNKLMDRLNLEMDFRSGRSRNKDFDKPYSNNKIESFNSGNQTATIDDITTHGITSFAPNFLK